MVTGAVLGARPLFAGRSAVYWGALVGTTAAIAIPLYLLVRKDPTGVDAGFWMTLAVMAYAGVHLGVLAAARTPRPIALTFWTFVWVWQGLATAAQRITGITPTISTGDLSIATRDAQAFVLVLLVAYDLAARRRCASGDHAQRPLSLRRLWLLTAAAVVGGGYYAQSIGTSNLFTSHQAVLDVTNASGTSTAQTGTAIVGAIGQVLPLVALLGWTAVLWGQRPSGQIRPPFTVWAWTIMLALNVIVNNPIGNSRQWAGTVLVGFLLSRRSFGVRAFRVAVPATTFVLAVLFPYLDYFRTSTSGPSQLLSGGGGLNVLHAMSVKDYDASAQLVNTFAYVHSHGFDDGHQLLGALLFFVPRSVWAGKADDTGTLLAHWLDSLANSNLSEPLWAESYLALGVPLAALVFAILSRVSSRLDALFGEARQVRGTLAMSTMLVPVLAGYQLIVLRGSLLQATGRLVVILLVFWFLFPAARRTSPEEPRTARKGDAEPARVAGPALVT